MSGQLLKIHDWESMARQAKFHPAGMAALCSVSLRQMERFFVERFNKTPIAWTRELRCEQARRLIAKGWTNKAVATELDFANESHLCHEFRKVYGLPPRSFSPTYRMPQNVVLLQ
jgi:transcriptional regulator GlxA family with amidase domain